MNDGYDPQNMMFVQPVEQSHNREALSNAMRHAISLVRRNLILIAGVVLLFAIVAIVLTMLQAPFYTARSTIEIQDQGTDVLGEGIQDGSQQVDNWNVEMFLNTQLDILRSQALAARVAQRLNLNQNDRYLTAMQIEGPFPQDPQMRQRMIVDSLRDSFSASIAPNTRIAQLSFSSGDPVLSAEIANAYAEEFIQSTLQRRFDSTAYARNFVADQLQEARTELESSERELNNYARQAGLIRTRDASSEDGNTSSSVTSASLMQLNEAANQAQAERVAAEARWQAERAQPLFSSSVVQASAAVQSLIGRRSQVQQELEEARTRYLPDHPTVQRLEAALQTVNSDLNRAAQDARNSVRADYVAAQERESELRGRVSQLEGATLAEQDRSVRYNTLAREADTNRQIYEGLLQRYRELNASAGIAASNVSIIDRARTPGAPSSPNLMWNLAIAMLLGGIVAGGIVLTRDQLDDRVRVPEDIQRKIGLPLLGVIPKSDSENPVEELEDPKSFVSEAYNALRTSLLYSTPHGLPRSLMVTSSEPAEGKSTTSFAIASSMAKIGKRVLIVDADMRRPSLHRVSGRDNRSGLSAVLVGEVELAQAVVPGDIPGLTILTSGPLPPSPSELLSSMQMQVMLAQAKEMFDLVVIDSPPILGLADAPQLATIADGAIMVIEAERGGSGKLKNAIRRLKEAKPTILGSVLTKFDATRGGNMYSAYYGYNYYSYKSENQEA